MSTSQRKLLALAASLALASAAHAAPGLVSNGDFEVNGGTGQLGVISSATGWSTSSGNLAFVVDTTADNGDHGLSGGIPWQESSTSGNNLFVWGPDNGSNNGFTGSPSGGYFLGVQVSGSSSAVTQTIGGLTVGHTYELTFSWSGAQLMSPAGGMFEAGWQVGFGGDSQNVSTPVPPYGFSGWSLATLSFTAGSTSQVLSFLATGTSNLGALALVDGIALTDTTAPVPEPQTYALMLAGLGVLGGVARRRRAR